MAINQDYHGNVQPSSIEQAGFEPLVSAHRFMDVPSNMQQLLDYDVRTDGQPVYMGFGARGLSQASTGWLIQKFTYNASGNLTSRQSAYTSWNLRADAGTTYA